MRRLRPCLACRRHVSATATECAFCATPLAPSAPASEPLARLSRAAVFVAGVTSGGCWTSKPATPPAQATQVPRSTAPAPVDAALPAPPPDPYLHNGDGDRDPDYQDHPCVSPGPNQPPVCAPYGAPPARRRIV